MILSFVLAANFIIAQDSRPKSFIEQIPGTLVKFKMVGIPSGESKHNGKTEQIKGFWIGETEVTWDMYDVWAFRMDLTDEERAADVDAELRPSRPYGAPDRGYGHQGYAALGATHRAAVVFCNWLSEKTGKVYRLPTEQEWEYAARAGASLEPTPIEDYAWFWDNGEDVTHPVASKTPNAWGLHDTLGNTAEWVNTGKEPVIKGGSFQSKAPEVKFGWRAPYHKSWQERDAQIPKSEWWLSDGEHVGFRVVCEGPN